MPLRSRFVPSHRDSHRVVSGQLESPHSSWHINTLSRGRCAVREVSPVTAKTEAQRAKPCALPGTLVERQWKGVLISNAVRHAHALQKNSGQRQFAGNPGNRRLEQIAQEL